jgi:hypothetical protein
MLGKLGQPSYVRLDIVVDFACGNSNEGIFYVQGWMVCPVQLPDVVEAGATDAAREVGMELSKVNAQLGGERR